VLGDLWLFNHKTMRFDELEIRLVQQVANHCAIAIRPTPDCYCTSRVTQKTESAQRRLPAVSTIADSHHQHEDGANAKSFSYR